MPTTSDRGYGWDHQQERARVKTLVDAGLAYCWRCHGWINPTQPWDLGHDDHDRTQYRGPEHTKCNRATATRRQARTTHVPRQSRRW